MNATRRLAAILAADVVGFSRLTSATAARLAAVGLVVGALAGFFGIGGGFLIVPGLVLATGMPMLQAVGTSLVSIASFGLTTAPNYALSDLVVWPVALLFVAGGVGGGYVGSRFAQRLSSNRQTLAQIFAGIVFLVALYMLAHSTGIIDT